MTDKDEVRTALEIIEAMLGVGAGSYAVTGEVGKPVFFAPRSMMEKVHAALQSTAALQAKHDALQAENEALRENLKWFHSRRFAIQAKFDLHGPEDIAGAIREKFYRIDALLEERP